MPRAQDFWNVPAWMSGSLYPLAGLAVAVFIFGFWYRARLWSSGKDTDNSISGLGPIGLIWFSVTRLFSSDCMFAKRVFPRSVLRALLLVGVMWGFILLFVGTVSRTVDYYMVHFLSGIIWQSFSLVLDISGLILLLVTILGLLRRYVWKPKKFISSIQDGMFLFWLLLLLITGFVSEGIRIVVETPPAIDWSPVGYAFGMAVSAAAAGGKNALLEIHQVSWFVHMLLALSFIAYIPYSKGFHIFASQITTSLATERKRKALQDS